MLTHQQATDLVLQDKTVMQIRTGTRFRFDGQRLVYQEPGKNWAPGFELFRLARGGFVEVANENP